jgi:hypothetical protein
MTAVMTYGRSYNFSHSPYLDFPAVKFLIIITKPHAPSHLGTRFSAGFSRCRTAAADQSNFFEFTTTLKMTFRDRIAVREIDVRALLCGRRPF